MIFQQIEYVMGLNCLKSLWFRLHPSEEISSYVDCDPENLEMRYRVQDLAFKYYAGGTSVDGSKYYVAEHAAKTKELAQTHDIIYWASAYIDNGCSGIADVMIKNGEAWDLIAVKTAVEIKDSYIDDMAYLKYLFEKSGYSIKNCKIIHPNNQYIRQGDIDVRQYLKEEDVSELVNAKKDGVEQQLQNMLDIGQKQEEPNVPIHAGCKDCPYYAYCGKNVPEYSVFDLLSAKKADEFYQETGSLNVEDVSEDWCTTDKQLIDLKAFKNKETHIEPEHIKEWLDTLEYPLYYLDYETFQWAVPLFDGANAYSQIPFQFSLHIQDSPDAEPKHIEFLHQDRSDPRRALAEVLIKNCGKHGSVVVYNQSFEMTRNKELAELFPDLADDLLAINERIVDQFIPFRNRALYNYKQKSSASIKHVLPAFSDLTYEGMDIANGSEAMFCYLEFMLGMQTEEKSKQMFADLLKYCGQDTYAMVVLMKVLYKYAKGEE